VICTIKANVTRVTLDATGIASRLQPFKSTDLEEANPASERAAIDAFRVVSPAYLLQPLSLCVVAQLQLAEKIGIEIS
jgi:hypothetical protein